MGAPPFLVDRPEVAPPRWKMIQVLVRFSRQTSELRRRIVFMYAALAAANLGAWIWALLLFHDEPVLLATALLAYGFGLRHAVDADHIAAIDNATRKLMQGGQRPIGVGFFFAVGHSAVVVLA